MEIRYEKAVIRQSVNGVETETEVLLPDFGDGEKRKPIGKWGQRRLRYIRNYRKSLYTELLTNGKLNGYLADLNEDAESLFSRLVNQLAENEQVTEELKVTDEMKWVRPMNNIRNRAAEVVNHDLIYA